MHTKATQGITVKHRPGCTSPDTHDSNCRCRPTFQAAVWSVREQRRIRKHFATITAARNWRQDSMSALRKGTMSAPSRLTLREAADEWVAGARSGAVLNRSGDRYKPSVVCSYDEALKLRVLDDLGGRKVSALTRGDLLSLVERMQAAGLSASTIRNAIIPLRAIYRRLEERGDVVANPTRGLSLPAVRGRRQPRVSREHAAALLAAVPTQDRGLWATAVYAGLRRGELAALRWEDVDLTDGVIRVERSYSFKTREVVEPKSHAGRRAVPITSKLRAILAGQRLRTGRFTGLVFGRSAEQPFASESVVGRARAAWKVAGLSPTLGLHDCRHLYASLSIAAGVNAKALSTYMGHASINITQDRYGHLMPGNEAQAARLLDDYLDAADGA